MLTVENIKKTIDGTDFEFYGLRVDDGIRYNIGDTANNSRQLFQDPDFDDEGELIYPYIEDGIYQGFYDAGELGGTCAIEFDAYDDISIKEAIDKINIYFGNTVHILGADYVSSGFDNGEKIMVDAQVIGVFEK